MTSSTTTLPQTSSVKHSARRHVVNTRLLLTSLIAAVVIAAVALLWYWHRRSEMGTALLARAEKLERDGQWLEAADYYQRCLLLDPDDVDILLRLVRAYAQQEQTPSRRVLLNRLLYRALGRVPERDDLRRMLAESLLALGDFDAAEQEARKIQEPSNEFRAAQKVIALSLAARAPAGDVEHVGEALRTLIIASNALPNDVDLAAKAATVLREHPSAVAGAVELKGMEAADFADQLMNRLVASDPKKADALLARYRYRRLYQLAQAEDDLQAALKLAPDDVEGLLLAAEAAFSDPTQLAQAETRLRQAIQVAPNDPRAYIGLARVLVRKGNHQAAIQLLRQGRNQVVNKPILGLTLVDCEIAAKELTAAEKSLRDVELELAPVLPDQDADTREQLKLNLANLHAKLDLANGKPRDALAAIRTARLLSTADETSGQGPQWVESSALLAIIYSQLNQWDTAAEQWKQLLDARPADTAVAQSAADAYLAAGNPARAVACLEQYASHGSRTNDLIVRLVQAQLMLQLSRPVQERNWSEFARALDAARKQAPDRWELVFAEFQYRLTQEKLATHPPATASLNRSPNLASTQPAMALLTSAEKKYGNDKAFLRGLAIAYQQLNATADVSRVAARYAELEKDPTQVMQLRVKLLVDDGKYREASDLVAQTLPALPPETQRRSEALRVRLLTAAGDLPAAQQLVAKRIEVEPLNTDLLQLGVETCLLMGKFDIAEKWEGALRQLVPDGYDWRYLRARRLVATFPQLSAETKKELNTLIQDLRSERPRWYPLAALAGQYALVRGDVHQAIDDLRMAIDLGDPRPESLQQLVTLLYQENRLTEAKELLDRLTLEQPENPVLGAVEIEQAIAQNRLADAVALAKRGVQQFPDDPMRQVWLASVLLRSNQSKQAADLLHQAASRFPNDVRVLDTLVSALVADEQYDEARRVVDSLTKGGELSDPARTLVAAEGLEALGDPAAARQQFEKFLAAQPNVVAVRLRFAQLLQAQDLAAARAQYERILQQDSGNAEARLELAALLAATGQEADWSQASRLLGGSGDKSTASAAANDRVRAMLLARRGRTRDERVANCQAARQILEQLIRSSATADVKLNRRLLVQVLEQEASLSGDRSLLYAAREQFQPLIKDAQSTQADLLDYLKFLLRHAAANEVAGSAAIQPNNAQLAADKRLREDFLADAESHLKELKQGAVGGADKSDSLASIALTVRLLGARGQADEAAQRLSEYLADETKNAADGSKQVELYLMAGGLYSTLGKSAEAERWYRRLMEISPRAYVLVIQSLVAQKKSGEAIDLCLKMMASQPAPDVAIQLANIMMSMGDTDAKLPQARVALENALAKHRNNPELLQAAAVMHAARGEYDDAITLLRRILQNNPNNVLALNNLATLLSDRPNQLSEALQSIERAIQVAGRQPSLLDTQGTIYLKLRDADKAVVCLEEATAAGTTDGRYYFHLAAAYQEARDSEKARQALHTARTLGLATSVLTDGDRELLAQLDQELKTSPSPEGAH